MIKPMQNLAEAAPALGAALRYVDLAARLDALEKQHAESVAGILAVQRALEEGQGHTVNVLRSWAREINAWADESLTQGWSTHQVERNRQLAARIHREADLVEAERERLLAELWKEPER